MASNADKFDCERCPWGRHCDEERRWPGSVGPARIPMWEVPGVIRSRTCLKPMVGEGEWQLVSLYRHYKNGFLPYQGGMLDQPKLFLEAMEIVESQMEKNAREEAERQQKRRRLAAARHPGRGRL